MSALKTNSEFCDDVLEVCIRKRLAYSGFTPSRVQYSTDGTVTVTFGGFNTLRRYIEKRVSFRALLPANPSSDEITAMAHPELLADACGRVIADIERKERDGLIRRSPFGEMARA